MHPARLQKRIMSNAILITGKLRTFDKIIDSIYESIIAPNNAVVFLACETDDPASVDITLSRFPALQIGGILCQQTFRNDDEFKAILTMIKTANRPGISPQVFERAKKADGLDWHYDYLESSGTILQYYQFWKIWNVLLDYEQSHQCKFENIIRTRTDIFINHPISMDNIFETNGHIHQLVLRNVLHTETLPITTDTVVTLGPEQVWIGKRRVFDKLCTIIFHYGLLDPGTPFAFSSEVQFHEFCKHHGLDHIIICEKNWPVYFYPDKDVNLAFLFGILR